MDEQAAGASHNNDQEEQQEEQEGLADEQAAGFELAGEEALGEQVLDSKTRHRLAQRRYRERIKNTIQDLHEEVRAATQEVDSRRERVNQLRQENQQLKLELERARLTLGLQPTPASSQPASSALMEDQDMPTTPSSAAAAAAMHSLQAGGGSGACRQDVVMTAATDNLSGPAPTQRVPMEGTSMSGVAPSSQLNPAGPDSAGSQRAAVLPPQPAAIPLAPQSAPLLGVQQMLTVPSALDQAPASQPVLLPGAGGMMFSGNLYAMPGISPVMLLQQDAAAQLAAAAGAAAAPAAPTAPVSQLASNILGYQLAHNQLPVAMLQGQPCQLAVNMGRSTMHIPQLVQLVSASASTTSQLSNSNVSTPPTSGSLFHSGLIAALPTAGAHQGGLPLSMGLGSSQSGALFHNLSAHFSSSSCASVLPPSQMSLLSGGHRLTQSSVDTQASPERQQQQQQQLQQHLSLQQQQQVWLQPTAQGIQFVDTQFNPLLSNVQPLAQEGVQLAGLQHLQLPAVQPQFQFQMAPQAVMFHAAGAPAALMMPGAGMSVLTMDNNPATNLGSNLSSNPASNAAANPSTTKPTNSNP